MMTVSGAIPVALTVSVVVYVPGSYEIPVIDPVAVPDMVKLGSVSAPVTFSV